VSISGLADQKLAALDQALAAHVDSGSMPGLVALVARHGQAHVVVLGTKAFDDPEPMTRDAIFRIASLSKPITAAVAMVLIEDGTLALDAPVQRWLPELADRRVLRTLESDLDDTEPAERPITVEDLLSFRLGFGIPLAPPDSLPVQRAEAALDLRTIGPPWPPTALSPDEWMAAFATLPLLHQPGQGWRYNTGAQVLGVLVERAAGRAFADVLDERLFDPLGMVDTGFWVPEADRGRFTTMYAPDPETDAPEVYDAAADSWWNQPPALPNGAGWMVSTVDDFAAFAQMLLSGGVGPGARVLSEASVRLMTTDRLTDEQRAEAAPFMNPQDGWGLGLAVPSGAGTRGIPGGFGWNGGTGTTWRSDPDLDLTAILFTQRSMTSPQPPAVFDDFYAGVYAAVSDET
jgi:CubicO group peptidase (beta-lactamase class C family)